MPEPAITLHTPLTKFRGVGPTRAAALAKLGLHTTADLLDGKITFHQYITPYTPAEDIEDVIEFDPDALTTALS